MLLRQVFANLIRNAAEACELAGSDAVDCDRRACRRGAAADASFRSTTTVREFQTADRSRIFQPFFTTRSRGSGLGLSIVQKIVLLHNGKVSVGCCVRLEAHEIQLTFPLAEA